MSQFNQEELEPIIRSYLPEVIHMSLATCKDNKPWVCEVHFAYDHDLNLYFCSLTSRRHSQEIATNPHVAGNIVAQHGPGEAPRGIYFEGTAELLSDVNENHPAYLAYEGRFHRGPKLLEEARAEEGNHFYQITVHDFYIFDARESKPAQKYHLPWKN